MSILDQIGGEKLPSAFSKDSVIGETVTGTIVKAEVRQMRDFATNKPEVWDDGNPKNQVVITLDPGNGEHVGVYVKAWGVNAQNLKDAVLAAGMSDLDRGATFTATFAREIPSDTRGFSPTKVYEFALKPASSTGGLFSDTTTNEATPPAPAPAPAAAPAAGAGEQPIADQILALHAAGIGQEQIVAALGSNPAINANVVAAVIANAA